MVQLLSYEPPDVVLELTENILLRHVIGLGSTGSGKTSDLITPILAQLLRAYPDAAERRVGLLVVDPKGDAVHRVRACAESAGRLGDLVTLGAGGNASLDLFHGFHRLDQTEDYVRRFLSGTRPMPPQDTYWTEAREGFVSSALVLLLACGAPVRFCDAVEFMRGLWFGGHKEVVKRVIHFAEAVCLTPDLSDETKRRLRVAFDDLQAWETLDARTRNIHRSTLLNALRPLTSSLAQQYLSRSGVPFVARRALEGAVLVLSVNASTHPELSQLLMRLATAEFFMAVQARANFSPGRDRLCALIADEFQLAVEPPWVEQMATLRSRGGFVVAATQSLGALDDTLGRRRREALLCNFGSHFFFHTTEAETQELASAVMGIQLESDHQAGEYAQRGVILGEPPNPVRSLICGPGALAQLPEHHAFVHLADGTRTQRPVWLVPTFISPSVESPVDSKEDDLARGVRFVQKTLEDGVRDRLATVTEFRRLMILRGRRLCLTPRLLEGICSVCMPEQTLEAILQGATGLSAIEGLERLPLCWAAGLAGISRRRPALLSAVRAVCLVQGTLALEVTSGISIRERSSFLLHERLNRSLYPSLWRPAKACHLHMLFMEQPDLKGELGRLSE